MTSLIESKHSLLKKFLFPIGLGASCVFAFAPWQWFLIAMIAPALLERQMRGKGPHQGALYAFLFGLGLFGCGISWVFVSIHQYSDAPLWAALAITTLFAVALSGVLAMMGACYGALSRRIERAHHPLFILVFPILWVLFEWVRTALLTGFPWLLFGYTLIDTPFQGLAPIVGVYGLSFLCLFIGMLIVGLFSIPRRQQAFSVLVIVILSVSGMALNHVQWTLPIGKPMVFGLVQGNIPQTMKWDPAEAQHNFDTYRNMSKTLGTSQVVVWPEAAFPYTLPEGREQLWIANNDGLRAQQALVTGVVIADKERGYTNSVVAIGQVANGRYDKYHLVPFGEYVPFRDLLGKTFDWLQLPMSATVPGMKIQPPLHVQGLQITPLICYEVVYPELARLHAQTSDVLLTVSNDTWFGKSLGPIQHMQMARMRALENGRMLVRATNNGITAIVDNHGVVRHQAPSHQAATLTGVVQGYTGNTPIMWLGHHTFLMLMGAFLLLILAFGASRAKNKQ